MTNAPEQNHESLDKIFGALSEPNRRKILIALSSGPKSVKVLAKPLGTTTWATLKHVRVLEESGLVSSQKVGRKRICQIQTVPLHQASDWIVDLQTFWMENLERLSLHLRDHD